MFPVESINVAMAPANRKLPPAAQCSRNHIHVQAAIVKAYKPATPASPPSECAAPMRTSAPHSHANQGCPPRVNEYGSVLGRPEPARIASPVRMCHPASLSRNNFCVPSNRNKQKKRVIRETTKARSGMNQERTGESPSSDRARGTGQVKSAMSRTATGYGLPPSGVRNMWSPEAYWPEVPMLASPWVMLE